MEPTFYDIVACCEKLKRSNIELLEKERKNETAEEKKLKNTCNKCFYIKIEYSTSQTNHKRQYHEGYAILYRDWAYVKPKGTSHRIDIKNALNRKEKINKIKAETYVDKENEIKAKKHIANMESANLCILETYQRRPRNISEEQKIMLVEIFNKLKKQNELLEVGNPKDCEIIYQLSRK
jgi:hypothetical protein